MLLACLTLPGTAFAQAVTAAPGAPPPLGRFQLVVVTGHSGSPFLIDTATGCIWHLIQHQETKRSTFIEVDVENLHWSWGSGAQQLLASRIDAANLAEEQKRALKQDLQKTGCGLSSVVLTPGPPPSTRPGPTPPAPSSPPISPRPRR
jgi:hypothetical protein